MSTVIPQRDLRNHHAQIIARVGAGESFTVTKDGVPIADVVPHVPDERPPMFRDAAEGLRWTPMTAEDAAAWLTDIRRMDAALDDTPHDPWDRG